MKEFNLSEKIIPKEDKVVYCIDRIPRIEVKEFIKRLGENSCMDNEQIEEINKLAGDKLI